MSREQFLRADRRVRRGLCLVLFLTSCAALGLALALPAWALARDWLRDHRGEGAVRLLVGLPVEVLVLGPLLLVPFLAILWVDRRFGFRCPGCKRSVTLACRYHDVLRSGRCCRCRRTLFEPDDGESAE